MQRSLFLPALLAGLSAVVASTSLAAQVTNPFQPGLRWSYAAPSAQPWLPMSVDFAAHGDLVLGAGSIGTPQALLFSSHSGANVQPLDVDLGLALAQGTVLAVGSSRADRLFGAAQFDQPDATHRQTLVVRRDALSAAHGASFAPTWTHDMGVLVNGPVKLAVDVDGTRVVAAVHDAATSNLRIDWLDAQSGALVLRKDLAASSLRVLSLSRDGSKLAIVGGTMLWVFDAQGAPLHQENLGAATNAMALSGDGQTIVVGVINKLRVLKSQPAGNFVQSFASLASPSEIATRCAVSDDGSTYAAGWWNVITGVDVRFEVWDGASYTRSVQVVQSGSPSGPQNFPEVVAVSRDGRRAAVGFWGVLDSQPEVVLVDEPSKSIAFSVDLPGSVQSLALDETGTRIAVGMKHAHANQFSSSGEFRLYDTGERDLQLLAQPQLGSPISSASLAPGATTTLFIVGTKLSAPTTFPNSSGLLWIDRTKAVRVFARSADATGRADFDYSISSNPAWIGYSFAIQAAARVAGHLVFSSSVLEPVIL